MICYQFDRIIQICGSQPFYPRITFLSTYKFQATILYVILQCHEPKLVFIYHIALTAKLITQLQTTWPPNNVMRTTCDPQTTGSEPVIQITVRFFSRWHTFAFQTTFLVSSIHTHILTHISQLVLMPSVVLLLWMSPQPPEWCYHTLWQPMIEISLWAYPLLTD